MSAAKISFPGFDAPAASFEAPLEMLSACHGRVERQCQTLLRLVPHLAASGSHQAAREAAQNVMRYFDTSARHHHADEEEDLFPALLLSAPEAELAPLRELIDALLGQHRELERAWSELRWKLEGVWLETMRDLDADEVRRMVDLYRSHIEREEEELLPLAARVLGVRSWTASGVRLRRGIRMSNRRTEPCLIKSSNYHRQTLRSPRARTEDHSSDGAPVLPRTRPPGPFSALPRVRRAVRVRDPPP